MLTITVGFSHSGHNLIGCPRNFFIQLFPFPPFGYRKKREIAKKNSGAICVATSDSREWRGEATSFFALCFVFGHASNGSLFTRYVSSVCPFVAF